MQEKINSYLRTLNAILMLIAVDVGNSRIKVAVFEESSLVELAAFDKKDARKNFSILFEKYPEISNCALSSVRLEDMMEFIPKHVNTHPISNQSKFPFVNLYQTPLTLGVDRMVLAAGAVLSFSGKNRLVIDAGTCITYDFVDEYDQYHGGGISPGLNMRYQALHNMTAKLPLLEITAPEGIIGASTTESMHSGVVNGTVFEIDGFIEEYRKTNLNFIIILTGGDAVFLADRLKNTIFANSNFLLESLSQTYQYQTNND